MHFLNDIRFAFRTFRRYPGVTLIAAGSLALGIGVVVAVFTVVNAVLLTPLDIPQSDELVSIYHLDTRGAGTLSSTSFPNYAYYRDNASSLSGLTAFARLPLVVRTGERPEHIIGDLVTSNYFSVLRIEPVVGRAFTSADDQALGSDPSVVLSYEYWRRAFAADPAIVGKTMQIHRHEFTVIGVAPPGFHGTVHDWQGERPSMWVPFSMYREAVPALAPVDIFGRRTMDWLLVAGRMRPGVTVEQTAAETETLHAQLKSAYPEMQPEFTTQVYAANDAQFWPGHREKVSTYLAGLLVLVAIVLAIACLNVAALLLSLAAKRAREISVRTALGAGAGRLVSQLLTEYGMLSVIALAGGAVVATWTTGLLANFPGALGISMALEPGWDFRVAGFAATVAAATLLLFGLLPARRAVQLDLVSALKAERAASSANIMLWKRLLAGQIALTVAFVACAGLLGRTLANARSVDTTSDPARLLLTRLDLASLGYTGEQAARIERQAIERAEAVPGVRSAALASIVPLGGTRGGTNIIVDDGDAAFSGRATQVDLNVVSPGYFDTMGIPLRDGRDFTPRDNAATALAAVVNEEMVRRFGLGLNAVGRRFRLAASQQSVEIVGVVRDGPIRAVRQDVQPAVYLPLAQHPRSTMTLHTRFEQLGPGAVANLIATLQELDPDLLLRDPKTMHEHVEAALAPERLAASLSALLAAVVLFLAATGVYGVVSFSTASRTRELGIRQSLGATGADLLWLVLAGGLRPALVGAVLGIAVSTACARLLESFLFGVASFDPVSYAMSVLSLLAVATLASLVPAWRAAKLSPTEALRQE